MYDDTIALITFYSIKKMLESLKKLSFDTEYVIELFERKKRVYSFLNSFNTNIDEIYPILQAYIEDYLINAEERVYLLAKEMVGIKMALH